VEGAIERPSKTKKISPISLPYFISNGLADALTGHAPWTHLM